MTRQNIRPSFEAGLANVSDTARAAWSRCMNTKTGRPRKTAPNWRQDPLAWAAWQGFRTGLGWHGENATFKLICLGDDARRVWDEISGLTILARQLAKSGV